MKISICLPSMYREAAKRAIKNIEATTRGDYEVIVVSQFIVSGKNVRWVREKPEQRHGSAGGQAIAAQHASGDLLMAFSDDRVLVNGWDDQVRAEFRKMGDDEPRAPICMGLRNIDHPHVGTVFGIYYPYFPVIRRTAGLWYTTEFFSAFGDCDLGLRVWQAGGFCGWGPRVLATHSDDRRKITSARFDEDRLRFITKWGGTYGQDWDLSLLRGYNLDVDPSIVPDLPTDARSIFRNSPDFAVQMRLKSPPYRIAEIGTINLVEFRGFVYAVPQALGPVDLQNPEHLKMPGITMFPSLESAKAVLQP